jgi:putative flippase GtrA
MNATVRWMRFNAVGATGMGVQLSALALLNHLLPGHYLLASAVAVETALLHNFAWHLRYTWRDRKEQGSARTQLLRFQLTNGLVSVVGNIVLMRVLVGRAHVPLLLANAAAILCCSLVNFAVSDGWAFASESGTSIATAERPG